MTSSALENSKVACILSDHAAIRSGIAAGGRDWIRANKAAIRHAAKAAGHAVLAECAMREDLGRLPIPTAPTAGPAAASDYPPTPGQFNGRCVAVTSINPNPARWPRQLQCVESWLRIGLPVITVNTSEELDRLNLPAGVTGVVCNTLSAIYDRPTQLITSLSRAGAATGLPTLLINSDIEIHGPVECLETALQASDKLTIGVRYNHHAGQARPLAVREPSGLDCFLLSPAMLAAIPDAPFAVGKPVWDYWLPHAVRSQGHKFHWINEPLFFHESHTLGWSHAEWEIGAKVFAKTNDMHLGYGSRDFRSSLDFNV